MSTQFLPAYFVWDINDYRGVTKTIASACLVLSLCFQLARLFYRRYASSVNIDDWPVCCHIVLVVVCCGLQIGMASSGLGLTIEKVQPASRSFISEGLFAELLLFVIAAGCSKLSLALTCKITIFDDRHKRTAYIWILLGAIVIIVLFGIIALAAQLPPAELHTMDAGQFNTLQIVFIIYLTLDALADLCTISLMAYEIAHLQLRSTSRNRLMFILLPRLLSIPVSAFFCRSLSPELLADDFTLQAWHVTALLASSLLVSSLTTSVVALGGALEGFDIRAQNEYPGSYAMSAMHSKHSPGLTKFSHTTSVMASGPSERKTRVNEGDAHSDQMPILPDGTDKDEGIMVSKTFGHSTETASRH